MKTLHYPLIVLLLTCLLTSPRPAQAQDTRNQDAPNQHSVYLPLIMSANDTTTITFKIFADADGNGSYTPVLEEPYIIYAIGPVPIWHTSVKISPLPSGLSILTAPRLGGLTNPEELSAGAYVISFEWYQIDLDGNTVPGGYCYRGSATLIVQNSDLGHQSIDYLPGYSCS